MNQTEQFLFDKLYEHYRPTFATDEDTERIVGKAIALDEQLKPTIDAMKKAATDFHNWCVVNSGKWEYLTTDELFNIWNNPQSAVHPLTRSASEKSLAEDWNSKEDECWNEL